MTNAIAIGEVGMLNDLKVLQIISHNLANAATPGYRRDVPIVSDFEALLSEHSQFILPKFGAPALSMPEIGKISDSKAGVLQRTGAPLDVALEGEGYFEAEGPEGVRYTRQGRFQLDAAGRLVTPEDLYVSGVSGEIRLLTPNPRIDKQGRIWEGDEFVAQLKLVNFKDSTALEKMGNGLYRALVKHDSIDSDQFSVRQGFLESSNVNVMSETVRLMEVLRHFEITQQVIKGYDSMLGMAIESIAEF